MRPSVAARAVFGLEMRSLLRDPRTVFASVVLPVLLIPAVLLASKWNEDRRQTEAEARVYRVAVTGEDAAFAGGVLAELEGVEGTASDAGAPAAEAPDGGGDPSRFRVVEVEDPGAALEIDSLDVHVEVLTWEAWRALEAAERTEAEGRADAEEGSGAAREAGVPAELEGAHVLRLHYHSSRTPSREGARALEERLHQARGERREAALADAGFPVATERVAAVEAENVATEEEVQGARLGRFLSVALLGLMVLGGSAVSIDTLAGEKERGTLQTLLTVAASRTEIVTGKLLAIMAVALAIALVQGLNLWVFLGLGLIDAGAGFDVTVSPGLAAGLVLLFLPAVALTAGVLLLSSAHASSYKEAQLYLTPVLVVLLVPSLAPLLPNVALESAIVIVPLANLSVAARDLLIGQAHIPALVASWLITAGAAAWVTARSVRALHDEGVVTGDTSQAEFLGGPELFPKRVLRWFLVFWAVKLLLEINLPIEDLRVAVLVGVGVVFLGFPLLVVRAFRLDPVEALALRRPRPGVWLGVLLGAPAGLVAAQTVFRLMDTVIPVPTELLENFGQAMMPEGIPGWQLVLLLSVLPGIAEELTFRGVLLHGLRRRFGPVGLVLVVGLVFGFFHFQLFRIPQTAVIGMMLTGVTLLSGSIFPAMLWHALNNALALYLGTRMEAASAAFEGWGWAVASFLILALAFRIIWVNRTPYPEAGVPEREDGDRSAAARSP